MLTFLHRVTINQQTVSVADVSVIARVTVLDICTTM